jgi:hypothetical protein
MKKLPRLLSTQYRRIRRHLRNLVFSVEEFHVEKVYVDHYFIRFTHFLGKYPKAVLMLMVQNGGWTKAQKDCVRGRYKHLVMNFPNPIGLHVHLTELNENQIARMYPLLPFPTRNEQNRKISYGLKFLNEIGLEPRIFVSGHWLINDDTLKVCRSLELTEVHVKKKRLQCSRIPEGVTLKYVRNSMHDYDVLALRF